MKEFTVRYFSLFWVKVYGNPIESQKDEILRLIEVDLNNRMLKRYDDRKLTLERLEVSLRRQGIDLNKAKTRKRSITENRMIFMHLADIKDLAEQKTIAAYCGGLEHAAVCHANKTIKNLLSTSKEFKAKYDAIKI
jgi:hypothetical protein